MMHISDGNVAFACQGVLLEPLSKIVLNRETRLFTMIFRRNDREIELDCPVDEEAIETISKNRMCGVGFFDERNLKGAIMVPMEIH